MVLLSLLVRLYIMCNFGEDILQNVSSVFMQNERESHTKYDLITSYIILSAE